METIHMLVYHTSEGEYGGIRASSDSTDMNSSYLWKKEDLYPDTFPLPGREIEVFNEIVEDIRRQAIKKGLDAEIRFNHSKSIFVWPHSYEH